MNDDKLYCGDKRIYDKKGAQTVINFRERKGGDRLRMYQCRDCGRWHITASFLNYEHRNVKHLVKKRYGKNIGGSVQSLQE